MPYYTGTANSFTDLRTALFNACVDQGWTLNTDILTKGSAAVQATINAVSVTAKGIGIVLQGGTGISGSSLVNPSVNTPRLGPPAVSVSPPTWPMEYFIHIFNSPDEVYLVAKFNVNYYLWLAFGVSNVPSLPGTGLWLSANAGAGQGNTGATPGMWVNTTQGGSNQYSSGGLFWEGGQAQSATAYHNANTIHINMDSVVWAGNSTSGAQGAQGSVEGISAATVMIARQPNAWNSEAILQRVQGYYWYASNKCGLVCDLKNARYLRIDNYAPGDVITLGPDKWKVYPFYKKDTTTRDGGNNIDHSGTFGHAIRYDGP